MPLIGARRRDRLSGALGALDLQIDLARVEAAIPAGAAAGERYPEARWRTCRMTAPLTPERILQAAEEVLRRHGPAKANVVDVARALGVSHGTVYRHFPSKQALREAVTGAGCTAFTSGWSRSPTCASGCTRCSTPSARRALDDPPSCSRPTTRCWRRQRGRGRARGDAGRPAHGDRRRRADRARDLPGHDALPSPRARRHLGRSAGRRRPRPHHRPNNARAARRPARRGTGPGRARSRR